MEGGRKAAEQSPPSRALDIQLTSAQPCKLKLPCVVLGSFDADEVLWKHATNKNIKVLRK